MGKYKIVYWNTDEDKELGNDIIAGYRNSLKVAVDDCRYLAEIHECAEVHTEDDMTVYFVGYGIEEPYEIAYYCSYSARRQEIYIYSMITDNLECTIPLEAVKGDTLHDKLLSGKYNIETIEEELADWVYNNCYDFLEDTELVC